MNSNKRLLGIDLLRIILALGVFLYHTNCNDGCTYGKLTTCINSLGFFMIAFFMLSGFVVFYTNSSKSLNDNVSIKKFILKRLTVIMPVYLLMVISHKIIAFDGVSNFITIPAEILGLQSLLPTSISCVSPNAGTWYISCTIICYICYPFISEIVKKLSIKQTVLSFVFISTILVYFNFLGSVYSLDTYRNAFLRVFEFSLGVLLCSYLKNKNYSLNTTKGLVLGTLELLLYFCFISRIQDYDTSFINHHFICAANIFVSLLIFTLLIITFSSINYKKENKFILYLSNISYCFYMAQVFIYCNFNIALFLLRVFRIENNLNIIIFEFIICFILAVLLYEFLEKPSRKLMLDKINQKL